MTTENQTGDDYLHNPFVDKWLKTFKDVAGDDEAIRQMIDKLYTEGFEGGVEDSEVQEFDGLCPFCNGEVEEKKQYHNEKSITFEMYCLSCHKQFKIKTITILIDGVEE